MFSPTIFEGNLAICQNGWRNNKIKVIQCNTCIVPKAGATLHKHKAECYLTVTGENVCGEVFCKGFVLRIFYFWQIEGKIRKVAKWNPTKNFLFVTRRSFINNYSEFHCAFFSVLCTVVVPKRHAIPRKRRGGGNIEKYLPVCTSFMQGFKGSEQRPV